MCLYADPNPYNFGEHQQIRIEFNGDLQTESTFTFILWGKVQWKSMVPEAASPQHDKSYRFGT